jgi:hypothetical protein
MAQLAVVLAKCIALETGIAEKLHVTQRIKKKKKLHVRARDTMNTREWLFIIWTRKRSRNNMLLEMHLLQIFGCRKTKLKKCYSDFIEDAIAIKYCLNWKARWYYFLLIQVK